MRIWEFLCFCMEKALAFRLHTIKREGQKQQVACSAEDSGSSPKIPDSTTRSESMTTRTKALVQWIRCANQKPAPLLQKKCIFAPRFPYIKSATRTPTELVSYATVVEMM